MTEPFDTEGRLELEWRALVESFAGAGGSPLSLPPERRMAASRTALIAGLEEVRDEWTRIRSLVDEKTTGRYINAGWTLKDLLAHAASWAREFRREVEAVSRHESFDYTIPFAMSVMGPTEWNEQEVHARRGRTLDEIFAELDEETARLVEMVAATLDDRGLHQPTTFPISPSGGPEGRVRVPPSYIIAGKCVHDRHHQGQIRQWLARLSQLGG